MSHDATQRFRERGEITEVVLKDAVKLLRRHLIVEMDHPIPVTRHGQQGAFGIRLRRHPVTPHGQRERLVRLRPLAWGQREAGEDVVPCIEDRFKGSPKVVFCHGEVVPVRELFQTQTLKRAEFSQIPLDFRKAIE